MRTLIRNALGRISAEEAEYIPESERPKAVFWARVHVAIYALAIGSAVAWWSIIPLMLIGGPRIYGAWHMFLTGLLQHGGPRGRRGRPPLEQPHGC